MDPYSSFFSQQGRMSDPGVHASLFENLPTAIPELVKLVQGITIHVYWAERYGLQIPPERMGELQLRSMERRLARTLELDPRPLNEPRPTDRKLIGNCRDYSLFLAALLRHQGVPARARCGFATYFLPDHFEDHWVAEYWNQEMNRWVMVDAQLDSLQCDVLKIGFDILDVPRDHFLVGGRAWELCRSKEQDPARFGILDMHGLGFVRGNLVRDVAALNKMELLPWDCWGVILKRQEDDPQDLALLDKAAALTNGEMPDLQAVHSIYESEPRLYMAGKLISFVNGKMIEASLN